MPSMIHCYAYINAKIKPIARGQLFETPLQIAMDEKQIGEVTGGGTLQEKSGEIVHCGVDLDLLDTPANIAFVCDFLAEQGAPKGSKIQFGKDRPEVEFGRTEGIGVYLNGTDLPAEIYQSCKIDVVMEKFDELTTGTSDFNGYWYGPTEVALYFYGPSADRLVEQITPFMKSYPLCQRARVVRIA